jgi:signal peptidase II
VAVLWISLVIVILDQLTKFAVKGSPVSWLPFEGMVYGSSKPLLGDLMRITFIENPGIAFGITLPGFKAVFGVFSIVASIAIVWYLNKHKHELTKWEKVSLALILGGAVGNLIDRVFYGVIYGYESLFYGRVVDFLDFGYKENWWPVFNIADSGVSVGVVLLMILLLKKKEPVVTAETSSSSVSDASSPQSIADHTEITSGSPESPENSPQHAQ